MRHNQAGDLPGKGGEIDAEALQLVEANQGKRGFTYTHKPMTAANMAAVKAANDSGFTVNLSANNLTHADELAALAIAPVVTVLPEDYARKERRIGKKTQWAETVEQFRARLAALPTATPQARRMVVCPATSRPGYMCFVRSVPEARPQSDCRLSRTRCREGQG